MKKYTVLIRAFIAIYLLVITSIAHGWVKKTTTSKGASIPMETYYIGRFSIAMPAEMKEAQGSRSHKLRDFDISEIVWPGGGSHEKVKGVEWERVLSEIQQPTLSKKANEIIIKTQDFPGLGNWAKGVFYYASDSSKTAKWAVLMDTGKVGLWMKTNPPVLIDKENKSNNAVKNFHNIGKSYRVIDSNAQRPKGDWFYLKNGAINLPYLWQEESDIRFEGHPLNLVLRIRMNETYSVKNPGLIEKTTVAIVSGYADSMKIVKNRSNKRTIAGLDGEEEVHKQTVQGETTLFFMWEYNGKKNSGENPRIVITMESPDGNLDEKLKIWDAILDSMKPMFVQKK